MLNIHRNDRYVLNTDQRHVWRMGLARTRWNSLLGNVQHNVMDAVTPLFRFIASKTKIT